MDGVCISPMRIGAMIEGRFTKIQRIGNEINANAIIYIHNHNNDDRIVMCTARDEGLMLLLLQLMYFMFLLIFLSAISLRFNVSNSFENQSNRLSCVKLRRKRKTSRRNRIINEFEHFNSFRYASSSQVETTVATEINKKKHPLEIDYGGFTFCQINFQVSRRYR